uniref:Anaphase-promoting complex subunit 10 n=1 Tax=Xenopus tropicalis TaxID=8364 RepID=A0A803KIL9_XENTR
MTTPNKTPPGADPNQLKRTGTVREIGSQAVWSLSSCKPGFGVDQLRDDNLETYWQSDGSQPHLVNIQFRRKTTVKALCIYADYKSDESYTPSKISVRVGNNFHNLQEIRLKVTGSIISPSSLNKQPSLYTQSAVKPVKQMQNTLEENVETLLSHARYNSQFKYKNRSIVQQWCSSTSGERSYSRSFPVITVTVSKSDCAPSRNCSGSPASCVVFPCY